MEPLLYITTSNRASIIYYRYTIQTKNKKTINEVLDDLCIRSYSTLNGRKEAISKIFHFIKNTPIFINSQAILFPIHVGKWNETYINACEIDRIEQIGESTRIFFFGDQALLVDVSLARIKRYRDNCLKIKENYLEK